MRGQILACVLVAAACAGGRANNRTDPGPRLVGEESQPAKQESSEAATRAYARGVALNQKGEYRKAIAEFSEAIRLKPDYDFSYNQRALAWQGLGELDKAIADFGSAIQTATQPIFAFYMNRGNALRSKKQFDKAYADLDKAVELASKAPAAIRTEIQARAFEARGLVQFQKKEYGKALADLNEALRLNPKLASAYRNRTEYWLMKNDLDRTIADLTEAIKLEPFASTYSSRATTWLRKKEFPKAISDYAEAIKRDPKDFESMGMLARLLATVPDSKLRDGKRALTLAKTVFELDKDSYESLELLASAHAECGDFVEAVRWQKKAVAHPQTNLIQARAHLKLYQEKRPLRIE